MSSITWTAHLAPSEAVAKYIAIAQAQWPGFPPVPANPEWWRTNFATITGADENGNVIGGCQWIRRSVLVGQTEVEIAGLGGVVLAPEVRGQGAGSALLEFADHWVAGQGYHWSVLFAGPERRRFYEAAGYSKLEGTVYVSNSGQLETTAPETLVMVKPLCEGAEPDLPVWIHSDLNVGQGQW